MQVLRLALSLMFTSLLACSALAQSSAEEASFAGHAPGEKYAALFAGSHRQHQETQ